jgi:hypothetical protein
MDIFIQSDVRNEASTDQVFSKIKPSLLLTICNKVMYKYIVKKLVKEEVFWGINRWTVLSF